MALAALEVFKAAAVEPFQPVDTEAAATAELVPASRLATWPGVTPGMPSEGARPYAGSSSANALTRATTTLPSKTSVALVARRTASAAAPGSSFGART